MTSGTLESIGKHIGVSPSDIADMDWGDIDRRIEGQIGKKLDYDRCDDSRIPCRGSVFLMLGRLVNPMQIAKRIAGMK